VPVKGSGRGWCLHPKGYPVYTRRGPLRKKLVHRVVMAAMCAEYCYYPLAEDGLPAGFDVHHLDFDKLHYCGGNLLLIEASLHSAMDQSRRADIRWGNGRHFEDVEEGE
jgi:hypothetical protein